MASLRRLGEASQLLARSGVVLSDEPPQPGMVGEAAALAYAAFPSASLIVSSQQIEAKRSELLNRIPVHLQGTPMVEAFIKKINGSASLKAIENCMSELPAVLDRAEEWASLDTNYNDQQNREEMLQAHINELTFAIRQHDKNIDQNIADMEVKGVVFGEDDKDKLAAYKAYMEAHPDDEEARKRYEEQQLKMKLEATRQANDSNSTVWDRDGVLELVNKTGKEEKKRTECKKEREEAQKKFTEEKKYKAAKGELISEDDDEPNLAQQPAQKTNQVIKEDVAVVGSLPSPQTPRSNIPGSGRAIG